MLSRRAFFGTLLGAAALAADPDFRNWRKGQRLISIPSRPIIRSGDVFTIAGYYMPNPITGQSTGFLQRFYAEDDVYEGGPSVRVIPAGVLASLPSLSVARTIYGVPHLQ